MEDDVVVAVGEVLALAAGRRGDRRCRAQLRARVAANGDELLYLARRWFPPWVWSRGMQRVYAIEVRDPEGRERTGLARVGGLVKGSFAERVEVRWDRDMGGASWRRC
jgi:hypothetical protein